MITPKSNNLDKSESTLSNDLQQAKRAGKYSMIHHQSSAVHHTTSRTLGFRREKFRESNFDNIVPFVLFHFRSLAMSMLVRKQYLVEDSCFAFEMEVTLS